MAKPPRDLTGMDAGLAAAMGGAGGTVPDDQAQTGDLFGTPIPDPDGIGATDAAPRGRGRPPGSRDRTTQDWTEYFTSRFRSPLVHLGALLSADPRQLARDLSRDPETGDPLPPEERVTLLEAVRLQSGAAIEGATFQTM